MSNFFSPEAILMLFLASLLDLFGIICLILDIAFGVGEILSYVPDVIGITFFGSWVLMRTILKGGTMEEAKEEASEKTSEIARSWEEKREAIEEKRELLRKKREVLEKGKKTMIKKGGRTGFRFGLATLGEVIPFLGAGPWWTIFVYSELKNS